MKIKWKWRKYTIDVQWYISSRFRGARCCLAAVEKVSEKSPEWPEVLQKSYRWLCRDCTCSASSKSGGIRRVGGEAGCHDQNDLEKAAFIVTFFAYQMRFYNNYQLDILFVDLKCNMSHYFCKFIFENLSETILLQQKRAQHLEKT